jgi:tetratricopeptide (TPR) repeat protein
MRQKFEELRENLEEFAEQDDYPMLVIKCLSNELMYVVTFFEALNQTHPADYVLAFPQPFPSPAGYLDGVSASIAEQVAIANPRREEEGLAPFPPVPDELLDTRCPPQERLFGLLMYLRGLIPNEEDHRVIIGFFPMEVTDWEGFNALMRGIMPVSKIPPWVGALRIMTYDDRNRRLLSQQMEVNRTAFVLTFEVDFSTEALTNQLNRDVSNPSVPVMERMTYMLQLAALDYSYKRYAEALEKYGILHNFYQEHEVPAMQAAALLGAGDVLRAVRKLPEAKERYQQGIGLAIESNSLAVLVNLLLSITPVCIELLDLEEAESYADSGTKVAAGALSPYAYCDFFELRGDAQISQGKHEEGLASYLKCEEVCQIHNYFHRWKSVLNRQIQLFKGADMRTELREAKTRLDVVCLRERQGCQEASP